MPGWSSAVRTSGPSVRASLPAEPEIFQPKSLNPHLESSSSFPSVCQEKPYEEPKYTSPPAMPVKDAPAPNYSASTISEAKRSSSPSRTSAASIPSLPRSISQAIGQSKSGQDSPVMNETLSVIDEHITDLNTPRHSVVVHDPRPMNDSASEYSSVLDSQVSYVAGPETDDEEDELLSEANVKSWTPRETADHLRRIGVDSKHCEIFEEQEISGDVLLEMDQEFIHMKEYNFGVMGRRLKTWHKIRQFQEEVKGTNGTREHSASHSSNVPATTDDLDSRIGSSGTTLPRISSLMERSEPNSRSSQNTTPYKEANKEHIPAPLQPQSNVSSATRSTIPGGLNVSPWRTSSQESPSRPSAASIRDMNHRRRHSSMDIGKSPVLETKGKMGSTSGKVASHKKQASFDRNWSMSNTTASHSHPDVADVLNLPLQKSITGTSGHSMFSQQTPADLERGYFSGPESDPSNSRKFLRKRDGTSSANHSRHSSFVGQQQRDVSSKKRHSRFGSADSIRDIVPAVTSTAAQAYHSKSFKSRFRSASARAASGTSPGSTLSPTVTNLEGGQSPGLPIPSPRPESEASSTSSPLPPMSGKSSVKQKRFGLRAISDAVTGNERALVSSPTSIPSSFRDTPPYSPSRTGSSTPSATSRSLDIDNGDASAKSAEALAYTTTPRVPAGSKAKTKKETSAYTKGLEKKSPAEQRIICDYSGWMKKKSSSLMTTWKPRLFFLRGRRLSYYYSEDDSEERGVIDISSHKVLRADQDPITNLHATITGSASTPIVQSPPATLENGGSSNARGKTTPSAAPFIFKLIPPKAGLSRAVQFTKPTIHYFQVDSVHEGRKWMAALMKATITYDPAFGLETTNKQKTISLAKARARKERPPALKADESVGKISPGPKSDETGLNIRGLSFDALEKDDKLSTGQNGTAGMQNRVSSLETGRSASRTRAASEATGYQKLDRQPTTS
jgi:PH domain/SAM domain (Sterile alpha motif)